MAQKIDYTKLIRVGAVWTLCYVVIVLPVLSSLLDFDFLSIHQWEQKWNDFLAFQWVVNTTRDFFLFSVMILCIPLWLFGWFLCYRLHWPRFLHFTTKRKIQKTVLKLSENKRKFTPMKMPSAPKRHTYVPPILPSQSQNTVSSASHFDRTESILNEISELCQPYPVETFTHLSLGDQQIPIAISTDDRAVLINIVDEPSTWSIDQTDLLKDNTWYSETGQKPSPAFVVKEAARALSQTDGAEVFSVVLLTNGTLLDAETALSYYAEKGVYLLCFKDGEPSDVLEDLESFLDEMFNPERKEGNRSVQEIQMMDTDEETQRIESVNLSMPKDLSQKDDDFSDEEKKDLSFLFETDDSSLRDEDEKQLSVPYENKNSENPK